MSTPARVVGWKAWGARSGVAEAISLAWRAGRARLLLEVLVTLTGAALPVAAAWFTKETIDRLVRADVEPRTVLPAVLGLVGSGLLVAVSTRVARYLRAESDRAIGLIAQDRLFASLERFTGLARFEDPSFQDTLRLAQQSSGYASGQLVGGLLSTLTALVTAAGFVGSLLVISPLLTLVVVLAAGPALLAQLRLSRRQARVAWEISPVQRREFFYSTLLSTVEAAKEIRLFGTGPFLRDRMRAERIASNLAHRRLDRQELLTHGGLALMSAAIGGAGLVWAAVQAASGHLSVGSISMLVAAIAGVQNGMAQATSSVANAHQQLLLFDHYLTVTRAAPDLPVRKTGRRLSSLTTGIELRDVWFRYGADHPWVLRGVNLVIPRGRVVALVGANGAGKSTLVKLLCRFYDPERGTITWDGEDIRDLSPEELRHRMSVVFQDFMRYDLTAAENVGMGDITAMGEPRRLEQAARMAGVHETLTALPAGYRTQLSRVFHGGLNGSDESIGVQLSGGQWQRVALARAFLRDRRDLLILDEPSSGLDPAAEYELSARLREHRAGQTSILISHRLGTIRDADVIVTLVDGRVAEEGSHDELMRRGGHYAELFRLQARGYQSVDPAKPAAARREDVGWSTS
ncbi:multidrug ABC transporter permease [Micromonospora qiuiae]|uniref:Multidrug ABC transporter permease n=1 Tax=Micromonospora qiuiae TaxID=502268 RepID=A0ABQ4JES3_9ACTN|nr:ABC transporter ATP-binding protein [Micromonospora qiuiae]GIJ28691.1 multidrug ABC transporter permease [Micromonospora qiuiae]